MPSRTGRRQFLAATAAGVGVLAGCTEGDDQPSESGYSSDPDDYLTGPGETVGGSDSDSSPSSGSSSGLSSEERQLLERYDDGIEAANEGSRSRERAVGAWNSENYASAERYYSDAEDEYRDARSSFRDALDSAYGLDNQDVREACEVAVEYSTLRRDAAREGQLSVQAAQREDGESANKHADETRSLEREASRLNILDSSTVKRILE